MLRGYLYLNLMCIHTLSSVWCRKTTDAYITWLPFTKLFLPVIYNLFPFLLGSAEQCHAVSSWNFSFPLFFLFRIHTFNCCIPQLYWLPNKCSTCSSSLYLDIILCYSAGSSGDVWVVQLFTHVYMFTYIYIHIYFMAVLFCVPEVYICPSMYCLCSVYSGPYAF